MTHRRLLAAALALAIVAFFVAASPLRATRAQDTTPTAEPTTETTGASEKLQVVVLIDVSGSMSQKVFGSNLPADLADIQAKIDALQQSDTFKALVNQSGQTPPEMTAAQQKMSDAAIAVDKWMSDHQYGANTGVAARRLADLAITFGCDPLAAPYRDAATAKSTTAALSLVQGACSKKNVTLTADQRDQLKALVAYLDDPDYNTLVADAAKAQKDYLTAASTALFGGQNIQTLLNDPTFKEYIRLVGQREQVAAKYKFPTRLDLAKLAAGTLIDLSRLDQTTGQRETSLALATFSDTAYLVQPFTTDYDLMQQQVDAIKGERETNIGAGMQVAIDEFSEHGTPGEPSVIILLSDGRSDLGLPSEQIRQQISAAAKAANVRICTVGIGTDEKTDVDGALLKGMADDTGGQYLFATSGEQLVGFFVACRQQMVASGVSQLAGTVKTGETADAGTFTIASGTTETEISLNYLDGSATMAITDPDGTAVDASYPGAQIEQQNHVQVIVIKNPKAGDWKVSVSGSDLPDAGTAFNVVIASKQPPSILPQIPGVGQGGDGGQAAGPLGAIPTWGYIIGAICCLGVVGIAVGGGIFFVSRRNKNKTAPPQ